VENILNKFGLENRLKSRIINDEDGLPFYLLLTDFAKNPNVRQKTTIKSNT
jgi:hypothetical protein